MQTTMTETVRRGQPPKSDRIRDGKQITLRFPPSIEREVHAMAEEEGLLTTVWIRRLVIFELRRLRRGKAGT